MEIRLQITLASLLIHGHEFIDTGHRFDREAFLGLLSLPEVKEFLADMERQGFTPLRRDGVKYSEGETKEEGGKGEIK